MPTHLWRVAQPIPRPGAQRRRTTTHARRQRGAISRSAVQGSSRHGRENERGARRGAQPDDAQNSFASSEGHPRTIISCQGPASSIQYRIYESVRGSRSWDAMGRGVGPISPEGHVATAPNIYMMLSTVCCIAAAIRYDRHTACLRLPEPAPRQCVANPCGVVTGQTARRQYLLLPARPRKVYQESQ